MRKILVEIAVGGLLVAVAGCGEAEAEADPAIPAGSIVEARADLKVRADDNLHARCPSDMPAGLNPPSDATLAASYPAKGVQIYVCAAPAAGGDPVWTLKAPHAVLFDGPEAAVIHFGGPSWQALDGSLVTATRTAGATPNATAIPWLLLQVATHVGPGLFADATWIQRLQTTGGLAPTTGCDAAHVNAQVLAPYSADYFFYHPLPAGKKHVRQCAAPAAP
jgi:hypothetical protein